MVNSPLWRCLQPAHHCLLCEAGSGPQPLCHDCHQDLPWNINHCPACALPLGGGGLCAACTATTPRQSLTVAPLRYEFPVDHLVAGLKYHRRLEHAPLLGQLLLEAIIAQGRPAPDLLLPVPLHPLRLAERGYNQALEIARPLSRHFRQPLEIRLLQRTRATAAQMSLDAAARARNPQGAFRVNEKRLQELGPVRRIAVIDDVMTTGATLGEISRLLAASGTTDIEFWVVARTL